MVRFCRLDLTPTLSGIPYASRGSRLLAFLLDVVLTAVPVMPLLPFLAMEFRSGLTPEAIVATDMAITGTYLLFAGIFLIAVFVVQLFLLSIRGQTVGKWLMHIRIVGKDTLKHAGFVRTVLLRYFVNGILSYVPGYSLVDILFIFRSDRRCLHDLIAGTIVIRL
ncbi:MAG: hypothetical protein Greene041619_730 [Candidatus Peregrinibacteria bacterium Greene0416_19]|nr:MAG: hypothetical protein Greene041619_730 [Candidatus Peregrinibacteria bacterium Greene0416_19]